MAEPAWEVVVIGAGPAGLLAATRAAECGHQVLLLEKNRKPGVKILMSGGTRCNLTHATDRRGIVEAFGRQGSFLHSALAGLSPEDLIRLIEAEGVPTKVEPTGKVFPVSNKAHDIQQALLRRLARSGALLSLGEAIVDWQPLSQGMRLITTKGSYIAKQVILTTGGQSYPGCGTTGDGYRLAETLGHTMIPPRPALVPLVLDDSWAKELSGITLPDVKVKVMLRDPGSSHPDRVLGERQGSFLFTHFGCSGPVVMDVSGVVTACPEVSSLRLQCDWLPQWADHELAEWIKAEAQENSKQTLAQSLTPWLPRRLIDALLKQARLPIGQRWAGLNRQQRERLWQQLKRSSLGIKGTLGFAKAEVTAGGIALEEVDSRTMRSKRFPQLLIAGEVLDLDGPIGGYNFQAAFSTGWLAGILKE